MKEHKAYYKIGEVAEILGESVSLVRFWSNSFDKLIKPGRNAKGDRIFSSADVDTFRQIRFLVKDCGLTLEGAERRMRVGRRQVEYKTNALELLLSMRSQLEEVKKML